MDLEETRRIGCGLVSFARQSMLTKLRQTNLKVTVASQFRSISTPKPGDVPPEPEWFADISSKSARGAHLYHDVIDRLTCFGQSRFRLP